MAFYRADHMHGNSAGLVKVVRLSAILHSVKDTTLRAGSILTAENIMKRQHIVLDSVASKGQASNGREEEYHSA